MFSWELKGTLKGLKQLGIVVKKYDIENHLIYLDIPWIDGKNGKISPKETAEKTKEVFQRMLDANIRVRYREI